MNRKSLFGLDENIVSALAYALGPFSGFVVYVMERENKTVRFHALQSVIFLGALYVINFVIGLLPIIGWISGLIIWPAVIICTMFLLVTALIGIKFKVPIIGEAAEQQAEK